ALLTAADRERRELDGPAHPEGAGAGRPVEIVRREREEIDAAVVDGERDASGRADRVDVERHAARAGDPADLTDRLNRADLVVGRHDLDERRVRDNRA